MLKYRHHSPNKLSGGQKQRVAIAGVVAMEPKCIVLDEPTAMLDPNGRADVIRTAHELNQKKGVTIILITHYMEEVVGADKVIVMDKGKVVMQGTPREIFSQVGKLKEYRLDVPQVTILADLLPLLFFKYYGEAAAALNRVFVLSLPVHALPAPVGVSFYCLLYTSDAADE